MAIQISLISFLVWIASSLISPLSAETPPTALPTGHLILLLHETEKLASENPSKKEIGAVTMRAATAIAQQAGIIILSPAIWQNLLFRRHWFAGQLTKPGSLCSLLRKTWSAHQQHPTAQTNTQLNALLNADATLMDHFYLWQQELTNQSWRCWYHHDASLIILIPNTYLENRLGLLPRILPMTYTAEEYATGLRLSQCTPLKLAEQSADVETLFNQARHLYKRSSFSLDALESLFIPATTVHNLLAIHWSIYMTGHGTYQSTDAAWSSKKPESSAPTTQSICGLNFTQFTGLLDWYNTHLYLNCLYYQSCYGGGQSLFEIYHTRKASQSTVHTKFNLHFPLIAGSLSEAPVHILKPRKETKNRDLHIMTDIDLNLFFQALETPERSWAAALRPITATISTPNDLHAISNTPLLLLPGHTEPLPVDVSGYSHATQAALNKHVIRAGIAVFSPHDEIEGRLYQKPFIVRGNRALLLTPPHIETTLEIHPYQRLQRSTGTHSSTFTMPALISLLPGNALHHCADLTVHDIGLKEFLTQSFLQLTKQKSSKAFLFDHLTLDNDIATHFIAAAPSWWENITATVSRWFSDRATPLDAPRITLKEVLVIVGAQKLTCIFIQPCQNNTLLTYKVTYARSTQADNSYPDLLPLTRVSVRTHDKLYAKYAQLCAKQVSSRDSSRQKTYTAAHENTENSPS
ncbi:MAG: hypothetical protein QG604_148 [Candidatus Dependentiae bacterium]|nr:hypothetical protein [Candidatus Dependentiae bacterium]